jgi:hypothetical protein
VAAIVGLALLAGQPAWAEICVEAADQEALRMRMLQTDLMVAALSCKQHDLYNAFVERFKPQLGEQGRSLKAFFKRAYKSNATAELDDFVTRLANESSLRGMRNLRTFCADSEALFGALAVVEAAEIGTFLAVWPDADRHGFAACTQQASIP